MNKLHYLSVFILVSSLLFLTSCSDDNNSPFEDDDDFFGIINVTMSGDLTGVHILDFANFFVFNDERHGSVFNMTGFKDGVNEIDTDVFINFYRAGGMVSATSYEALDWEGFNDELDPSKIAISFQVTNDDNDTMYFGHSVSGSVNFTNVSNNRVEGEFNVLTNGMYLSGDGNEQKTVRVIGNFIVPSLVLNP